MALSKAKMRLRKRIDRGTVKPSQATEAFLMPEYKRKERLAEIIVTPIPPEKIKAGHIIAAIKELNLMEHIYDTLPQGYNDNRQYTIIIQGEGAKSQLETMLKGKVPELQQPQDIVEGEVVKSQDVGSKGE